MSDARSGLKKSTFAAFLAQENARDIISRNADKVRAQSGQADKYSKFTRILDDIPQHAATIPLIKACKDAVKQNKQPADISFSEPADGETYGQPILNSESKVWLNLVYASTMFELFDIDGNLRQNIRTQISELNLGIEDKYLKVGLFAAYMEDCIGGHLCRDGEEQGDIAYGIAACASALTYRMSQIIKANNFDVAAIRASCAQSLGKKYREDEIKSELLKQEIKILIASFVHETACKALLRMRANFNKARADYLAHLDELTQIENIHKKNVLDVIDDIVEKSKDNSINNQIKRLTILTEVLRQTQAYTPSVDEKTREKYSDLIAEVSKHAWGKRLASAMSSVPIAALLATFVLFSIATGGTAIPFLAGIGFAALLGITIVSGVATVVALSANLYTLWHGFKHKPIADAMKGVRDKGKEEVAVAPAFAGTTMFRTTIR